MARPFESWEPLPDVPTSLMFESFCDDIEGVRLLLREQTGQARVLRLTFPPFAPYRSISESYRSQTWERFAKSKLSTLPTLLIVRNSDWVNFLVKESGGILEAENLTHYGIYTDEECFDVVTEEQPMADWLGAWA